MWMAVRERGRWDQLALLQLLLNSLDGPSSTPLFEAKSLPGRPRWWEKAVQTLERQAWREREMWQVPPTQHRGLQVWGKWGNLGAVWAQDITGWLVVRGFILPKGNLPSGVE